MALFATLAIAAGGEANAQEAPEAVDEGGLPTIIVTAQKRSENLQDVPISISTVSGDDLRDSQIPDSTAIARIIPNFNFAASGGANNFTIRGVGNNDFNFTAVSPISVYRDGVVIGANAAQRFALLDLDRVEVLRGPQGTLFGKNTTGGAVQYVSKLPGPDFEGYARLGYGRFGRFEGEMAATLPIAKDFSVRVAGIFRRSDGDRINMFNGERANKENVAAARAIFRYDPGDLDIRLTVGVARDRGDGNVTKSIGTINGANVLGYAYGPVTDLEHDDTNVNSRLFVDDFYVNFHASKRFGDFALTSISSYQDVWSDSPLDADGSPVVLNDIYLHINASKQYTQEVQLNYDASRLKAVAGLYYFHEKYDLRYRNPYAVKESHRNNDAYAAYAQATYSIADGLNLTGGIRYTDDKSRSRDEAHWIVPLPIPDLPLRRDHVSKGAIDWRVALDYEVKRDMMVYGSVARGFKAGGVQIGIVANDASRAPFGPEYLTAFEAGVKSSWFDRRLRANLGLFYYDYKDIQVQSIVNQNTGNYLLDTYIVLENAASASLKGLELELAAVPVKGLELNFNLGLNDGKYKKYLSGAIDPVMGGILEYSGNRLPNAPKVNFSSSIMYEVPLGAHSLALRADYSYKGLTYYNSAEQRIISNGNGYGLLDLRASFGPEDRSWTASIYGRNVTGKKYITYAGDLSAQGYFAYIYGPRPRWGGEISVRF